MKFILATVFFIGVIGLALYTFSPISPETQRESTIPSGIPSDSSVQHDKRNRETERALTFVAYWNIPEREKLNAYDRVVYFGVAPSADGTLQNDAGMRGLAQFVPIAGEKDAYLTIRMLDDEVNAIILKEKTAQARLVERVVQLAREYGFSGVVLDFEMSVLPLDSVRDEIAAFFEFFGTEIRKNNLHIAATIYGDVFYRARPYDMASIGQSVDEVMIMAYDFHKSRGEPGPNFPFDSLHPQAGGVGDQASDYGYDFKTMITDFTSQVPPEKITVLFGMYGYDWTLGNQGLPLKRAKAVPLREIERGFSNCETHVIPNTHDNPSGVIRNLERKTDKCMALMNDVSKDKSIQYVDDEGFTHELWYEDFESVEVKKEFMKTQGIGSVGYWVWGYY